MEKTIRSLSSRNRARLEKITDCIERAPALSFPQMCAGSELEGIYRFFANVNVTPEAILEGHFANAGRLASEESEVVVVHDTTRFDFSQRLGTRPPKFYAHVSLALSCKGYRRPLGVVGIKTWLPGELENKHERWFEGVTASCNRLGRRDAIHVMDRESDDYALFAEMLSNGHRFVTRLTHKSRFVSAEGKLERLGDAVAHIECAITRHAKLSPRIDTYRHSEAIKIFPSRDVRVATLAVGGVAMEFKRPKPHHRNTAKRRALELPPMLRVNVVRVWEPNPLENEPCVEWVLVTSEPIDTPAQIAKVVDLYRMRWTIEEYFKVIKTGCAYEARQLGDYENLCNALATFIPIACRALELRSRARDEPTQTEELVLQPDEVEVLRKAARRPLPQRPTTRDIMLAVAALGGHIKWSGDPGWLTISRGLQKLELLVEGWRLAKLQ
jgi:hypothetical protein